jgi:NADH-quinone oxidoreductase subunit F
MNILLKEDAFKLDDYIKNSGYSALARALKMERSKIIDEVKKVSLRGRGGAGFPAGVKWGFVPQNSAKPVYLICNADEGEPGTFKDRELINKVPHMLLEGILIASYAIGARVAYIYIRGEFDQEYNILIDAINAARKEHFVGKNILGSNFNCEIFIHRGRGAYICGEETALMDSIEGLRGHPRLKPPFPAQFGIFGCPTNVNNVETLACVPHIILNGADWFCKIGPEKNYGPKLFCVSGHVEKPGVYELPMGTPLPDIINKYSGGVWKNRKLKAIIPGGSSTPVLKDDEININMDFDSVARAGSMLGSGGIIVMDETTCMVKALYTITRFYAHESCGQCSQCRIGTDWAMKILNRIEEGRGESSDLDMLLEIADNMKAKTVCPFSDAAAMPIESFVKKFKDEFEYHIKYKKCEAH